ncbi:MAG: choice-of-anchor V domain-containing protein [Ignavibacteria bacterium]|nr:choice-of-anchor V domain-containing protein [Ignavibacteria bacterium]
MKNYLLLFAILIFATVTLSAYPGGISGATKKSGSTGCNCHTSSITTTVSVVIQGPATLQPSQTGDYTVTVSGGAGTAVGVDIATSGGTLKTSDGNLKVLSSELTQPSKKVFSGGQYVFKLKLTAPATTGKVTLYATACSKKSQWNYGSNFEVTVQTVSGLNEETVKENSFQLNQNYPNPFNPSTKISYRVPDLSKVSLKVYDILGNEVATLVDEEKMPGNYEVTFNLQPTANHPRLTGGVSTKGGYASGVYFYQLKAGNLVQTRKMILTK